MQEFRYFRGEACLAVSLEVQEGLCKWKCSDKERKKRKGKAELWISNGHMIPAESELQPLYGNYICGSATKVLRQPSDCPLPAQLLCTTSLPPSTYAKDAPHTVLFNTKDDIRCLMKFLNLVTAVKRPKLRFLIQCYENILARLFSDILYSKDSWPVGITGLHFCHNNNVMDHCASVIAKNRPDILKNNNNNLEKQRDTTDRDGIYSYFFNPRHIEDMSGKSIKRKSVSFADDVIVYMFDQESPTVKLHLEPYTSASSSSELHSDVTFDDNGLEWKDDFLALEKSCHSHSFGHSMSRCYALSLPTQNWTECEPEPFFLSQSCLFLTHVTESDLEL